MPTKPKKTVKTRFQRISSVASCSKLLVVGLCV